MHALAELFSQSLFWVSVGAFILGVGVPFLMRRFSSLNPMARLVVTLVVTNFFAIYITDFLPNGLAIGTLAGAFGCLVSEAPN